MSVPPPPGPPLAAAEVLAYQGGGPATGAHRQDFGGATCDDIAPGENPLIEVRPVAGSAWTVPRAPWIRSGELFTQEVARSDADCNHDETVYG